MERPIEFTIDYATFCTAKNIMYNTNYPFNEYIGDIIIENITTLLLNLDSNEDHTNLKLLTIEKTNYITKQKFPITETSKIMLDVCKKRLKKCKHLNPNIKIDNNYVINLGFNNYIKNNKEHTFKEDDFNEICNIISKQKNNQQTS